MTLLMYGLVQPQVPEQLTPKQLFRVGLALTAAASWLRAASTLSVMLAAPVLTSIVPSGPIDAVMLTPSAINMKTLP